MTIDARKDGRLFAVVSALVFVFLVLRAALMPMVHDEARAYQLMVIPGDLFWFSGPWDVGNHMLHTVLMYVGAFVLGPSLFVLRIWSLLAFVLYAWYTWRCGHWFGSRLVRWCFWGALLGMPFLLDFFALARGYALGVAFLMMSAYHVVRFARTEQQRDLLLSLVAMALGVYALLSMLVVWCALLGVSALLILLSDRRELRLERVLWLIVLGALPMLPPVIFGLGLSARGMLYAGTADGLYAGTLFSLTAMMFGKGMQVAPVISAVLFALAVLVAVVSYERERIRSRPVVILSAVATLTLIGQGAMSSLMHVLYPIDRSALYLLPLGVSVIALAIDHVAERRTTYGWLALVLLTLPLRSLSTVNFSRTVLWSEQSTPSVFREVIEERQRKSDRLLMIGGQKFLSYSWSFENNRRNTPVNELDIDGFPQPMCDLLLIDTTMYQAPNGFRTIARAPGGRNNLMERVEPLRTRLVEDSTFALPRSSDEYAKLWEPIAAVWRGRSVLVDLDVMMLSDAAATGSQLVIEVTDNTGAHLQYSSFDVDHQREATVEGRIRIAKRISGIPTNTERIAVYVFNPLHKALTLEPVHMRIYEVLP